MWLGVQVAVYICFIWSLDLEVFDWGLKLIGVVHSPPCWLVTVLKTCFSTSQPEGSATKYIHIFITWSNWNRTWLWHHFVPAMSRVVPSSFLYGMLCLNQFPFFWYGCVFFSFFTVMLFFWVVTLSRYSNPKARAGLRLLSYLVTSEYWQFGEGFQLFFYVQKLFVDGSNLIYKMCC